MRIRNIGARLLSVFCLLIGTLSAHGGQYRGPASGGQPSGPVAPGAPVAGGPITGGNANLDVNSWRVWWQLNHDRYVRGAGSQVTDDVRRATVLPSLKRTLDRDSGPDITSASLIAMGKAAVDLPGFDVLDVLRERLSQAHREVREAAVLGLGLTGRSDAVDDLGALLLNTRAGRRLVSRSKVGDRTRTFAAYALGVLAQRSDAAAVKAKVLDRLVTALTDKGIKDRDLLTGVLNSIRVIDADPNQGAAHKRVSWTAVAALETYLQRRLQNQMAEVQSHGLTALAALVGRGTETEHERAKKIVVAALKRGGKSDATVAVSATIALGELLRPEDEDHLAVLISRIRRPVDSLVPKFGMIAFGQIGGEVCFEQLAKALRSGKRDLKPWAALGLGILAFEAGAAPVAAQPAQGKKADWRGEATKLLQAAFKDENSGELRAALAIGLGLAGAREAAPRIRKLVGKHMTTEDFGGLFCVSLAMLDDKASVLVVRRAMRTVERPVLFGQAGLALAKFGELDVSAVAVGVLQSGGVLRPGFLTRLAAAAQALGYLKNANDVPALAEILDRARRVDYPAAFAAAALGSIADRDDLGFGARIAHGMNYTTRAQTISNGKDGILDIF